MAKIDQGRPFVPVNIAVVTVSDTRSQADDKSGDILVERLTGAGHRLAARAIVVDEQGAIIEQLQAWIADPAIDVVLATGGTGLTGRDVTPEAFHAPLRQRDTGFRRNLPRPQPGQDRRLDDPVPRHRRRRRRHLSVRAARLARRLPRRLGRYPLDPARHPPPPLQLRRTHAPPKRALSANDEVARAPPHHHRRHPPPAWSSAEPLRSLLRPQDRPARVIAGAAARRGLSLGDSSRGFKVTRLPPH